MIINSKAIELYYIRLIKYSLRNYSEKSPNLINCSCPICGDSKHNKTKARFYFICDEKENTYYCVCHNCNYSSGFKFFLKENYPEEYRRFLIEVLPNKNQVKPDNEILSIINKPKSNTPLKNMMVTNLNNKIINDYCIPAIDSNIAKDFYYNRQLPKEKIDLFFHTDRFGEFRHELNNKYSIECKINSMFVIPFYYREKLIGIQGRNYDKESKLRYLISIRDGVTEPLIFNRDNINTGKDIFVLEGVFDSLFFDNAIACNGTSFNNEFTAKHKDRVIIIPDNEKRNPETLRNLNRFIENNWRVWLPSDNMIGKDINEMIQNGISIDKIYNDIEKNTFQNLTARVKFSSWKQSY